MAQNTAADESNVRKEADAELYTVDDDADVWVGRAAMNEAARQNGDAPERASQNYNYEVVREFANSTLVAVWDTRQDDPHGI